MESDISIVGTEEKLNAVRLNADLLVKEKKYEIVPLCINWARIFYRNIVHIMQYVLLVQVALAVSVFLGLTIHRSAPFATIPMLLAGLAAVSVFGLNIFNRQPGPRLEDNVEVIKDDRVTSLQVLVIIPFITGIAQAIAAMLSYEIALYASGGVDTAQSAAFITFAASSFVSSLSIKFDSPLFVRFKQIGRTGLYTGGALLFLVLIVTATPLKALWQTGKVGSGFSFWIFFFAVLLSLGPGAITEWMKFLKRDDPAEKRDSDNTTQKGENP